MTGDYSSNEKLSSGAPSPARRPGRKALSAASPSTSTTASGDDQQCRERGQVSAAAAATGNDYLSGVTSLIGKADTTYDYIPSEDIRPCAGNPAQELSRALRGLETQDWPDIFHTLNTFRKLALHHPHVLAGSGALHNIVLLVMKRVDALRSSLAKNALITIGDMLQGLGKAMDAEVATIMPGIMKVR